MPETWSWCRLRSVIRGTGAGKSPNCDKRPKNDDEWGVLTTTAIQYCDFLPNENKVLPANYTINADQKVELEDLLITRAGPRNRTGIVCVANKACDKLILSDKTVRIEYIRNYCNPYYLMFVLNSPAIHDSIMAATVGMADSQVNISQNNIQNIVVPIPPHNEQQRIVNKLDVIIPLLKKYSSAKGKQDKLNNNIHLLIKKSILQEAIQGKLVPQDPQEESSCVLLQRIKEEKQRLVTEGKLKKNDVVDSTIIRGDDNKYWEKRGNEIVCIDDEIPFDIPNSWTWCRIKDIFQINPKNNAQDDFDAAFIPMEKIDATYLSSFTYSTKKWGEIKKGFTHFADGDVAFAKITPCFQNRKSMILRKLPNGIGAGTTELKVLRSYGGTIVNEYLLFFLESSYFVDEATFKGTANQQRIISGYLENKLFPLPPFQEQQRIVNAVLSTWQVL